jgi:uncharacterized protein YpmB
LGSDNRIKNMTDKQKDLLQSMHQKLTVILLPILTALLSIVAYFVTDIYTTFKQDHDNAIKETQRSISKDNEHDFRLSINEDQIRDIRNKTTR